MCHKPLLRFANIHSRWLLCFTVAAHDTIQTLTYEQISVCTMRRAVVCDLTGHCPQSQKTRWIVAGWGIREDNHQGCEAFRRRARCA